MRGADGFHRPPAAPVLKAEDVACALLKASTGECGRGGDVAADEFLIRGAIDERDFLQVGQQQAGDRIKAQISVRGDGVLFGVEMRGGEVFLHLGAEGSRDACDTFCL